MISAKRNKEGEIIVSGLGKYENLSIDDKYLMVNMQKRILIEDETEPKFIPTHEELLQWGFNKCKDVNIYSLFGKQYEGFNASFYYYQDKNLLQNVTMDKPYGQEIPFHTKQDFMKCIGVTNNVSDFKITYIPSEKTLIDLGFTRNLTGWDKKFFTELRYIGYTIADNEFEDEDGNALFLHSDSELKMLVDILSRES